MYSLIMDVGEKLRTVSDPETNAILQEELSQLQESWGNTQAQLEKKKMQLSSTLQVDDALPRKERHLLLWHRVWRASLSHHPPGLSSRAEVCSNKGNAELLLAAEGLRGKCLSCTIRACWKPKLWSLDSPKENGVGIHLLLQRMFLL